MSDPNDPDLTGQEWPDPPPDEQTAEAARLGIPFHRDLGELDLEEVRRNVVESDDPVVFVESSDEQTRQRIARGELDPEEIRQHALNLIADGFDLPREIVHDYAGTGWDQPTDMEQLLVRERAAQARHRARTRQLQDIQNTAITILIPLIGFISAVLLAGVARLVWLL